MISIWKESESGQILLEESESGSKLIQFENPQRIIGWVSFLQHLPSKRNLLSATFTERSNSTAACSKRYVHYNIHILIRSVVLCLDNHKGITRPNTITFLSVLLKNGLFYVITWKLLHYFFVISLTMTQGNISSEVKGFLLSKHCWVESGVTCQRQNLFGNL